MCLIFVGKGYPQNFFNLENFPNYGNLQLTALIVVFDCSIKVYWSRFSDLSKNYVLIDFAYKMFALC